MNQSCLFLVNVLMPYNFVCNPVKDVKNEEGEWERSTGYCINPFCTVNELLFDGIRILWWCWRWVGWGGLDCCAIFDLEAVTHPIATEIESTVTSDFIFLEDKEDK